MKNLLKKILISVWKSNLLGLLIRSAIVVICIFFISPLVYPLKGNFIKVELVIIIVILCEFIIMRIDSYNKAVPLNDKTNGTEKEFNKFIKNKLDLVIKNRPCFLFLHTSSVSIPHLLSKQSYSLLEIEVFNGTGIELFDNFYSIIISCELNTFHKIIEDYNNNKLSDRIIKYLKNSKNSSISLVLSVDDLLQSEKQESLLYRNFYSVIQFMNYSLGNKYNINILIDQISQIRGFENLLHNRDPKLPFGINFVDNIANFESVMKNLQVNYRALISDLDLTLFQNYTKINNDYRDSYYFIEQIRGIYRYIQKLVENIIITNNKGFLLKKSKTVLFSLHFIDSKEEDTINLPYLPQKFRDYISITGINNV